MTTYYDRSGAPLSEHELAALTALGAAPRSLEPDAYMLAEQRTEVLLERIANALDSIARSLCQYRP